VERPVHFTCGNDVVYGILHTPEDRSCLNRHMGLLILSGGIRPRTGQSRQYVKYSRKLCEAGHAVLRFDMPGLGDSEGTFSDATEFRPLISENIEVTMRAIDFFSAETGLTQFGVFGVCGGAHNALVSAAADPRVLALLLLALPTHEMENYSEESFRRFLLSNYLRSIFRWRSWLNLLLLRTNFHWVVKALSTLWKHRPGQFIVDETLWRAFEICMVNGKRSLFIFGENDPYYQSFLIGFGKRIEKLQKRQSIPCQVYAIRKSDHIISQLKWQNELITKAIAFLQEE
jgi:pimeloyl-ACP methyl ester carboxylesterase